MKWLERQSLYAKNRHLLQLETDEERKWTDDQIRVACDNSGDPDGYNCPFGGYVNRKDNDIVEVFVYIE